MKTGARMSASTMAMPMQTRSSITVKAERVRAIESSLLSHRLASRRLPGDHGLQELRVLLTVAAIVIRNQIMADRLRVPIREDDVRHQLVPGQRLRNLVWPGNAAGRPVLLG